MSVRSDRRQIQTAVLGGAESEDPLMLPLEAIELDAFRRRHGDDTFWCGLLLGGCGGRLTTKLYTDRVCHFAHHPGADGLVHECGRHARGVASADHLYVKSAATSWLQGQGEQARFDFARPDGVPIGSVVDIQWERGGLRVHLDQVVAPVWDEGSEPVLSMSVPVDRDTLIRRWYVHRIRLESEGTTRRVRIGTEAFARPTEWFKLDECEMTDRGLSTPAVQRIVSSRRTPPPSRWPIGKARKAPDAQAQAPVLLRRLAEARRVEAVVVVSRVCDEITAVTGGEPETQAQLVAAVEDAHRWLEQQAEVRRELFSRLEEELAGPRTKTKVRELLVRVNAHANHDRTTAEHEIADAAAAYLATLASAAAERARALLDDLRRAPWDAPRTLLLPMVEELVEVAAGAGSLLHTWETRQMASWMASAGFEKPAAVPPPQLAEARAAAAQREKNKEEAAAEEASPKRQILHKQVARRFWTKSDCPLCHAGQGVECRDDDPSGTGEVRRIPHDERLQPIVDKRKAKQQQRPRPWRVYDLACPDCGREPGERCATPGGPHYARVERSKEYTRMKLHPPAREALDGAADQVN